MTDLPRQSCLSLLYSEAGASVAQAVSGRTVNKNVLQLLRSYSTSPEHEIALQLSRGVNRNRYSRRAGAGHESKRPVGYHRKSKEMNTAFALGGHAPSDNT